MCTKAIRSVLFFSLLCVVSTGVVRAGDVTTHVYIDFVGALKGTAYTRGYREIDTTGTFAAHHGTEIVSNSLGVLTDADAASQESFEFDASAFNKNASNFTGTAFVVEAVFTRTGTSDSMAPIIDIGGQCFIRFHTGLSAGNWNGSTDVSNNNIQSIPAAEEVHHYAIVYDGANTINYYLDGVQIFQSVNGSPQSITKWISWGNIRHSSVNGGRQLIGEYDAVAFSTFTGAFDPAADFVLPEGPGSPTLAGNPQPLHEAQDVPSDAILSWTAGSYAATHDVYFGTDLADVSAASTSDPRGVLVGQGQTDTAFDPEGRFSYGQTYYWRVDEVNGAPDYTVFKGDIWSFTAEPYAYPITQLTVKASGQDSKSPATATIDGSGLKDDQHSINTTDMWMVKTLPAWIEYTFDQEYLLDELWVWNANSQFEAWVGWGARNVTIEYSTDGQTWATLENVPEFGQGTGEPTYEANTTVNLGGVTARHVRLTINTVYGAYATVCLSEVRFYYVPVKAFNPEPADDAMEVGLDTTLNWRPGREATSHEVYFGTDANAVAQGTVTAQAVADHRFTPGALDFGTTYYWKVNEVGDTGTREGDVWSFTSRQYEAIDDFESYNDSDNCVFDTWKDGYTDKSSGSQVGYIDSSKGTFGETIIVHGGGQSMPMLYNNTASPYYSQATRTFDSALDLSANGADSLSLHFRGIGASFVEGSDGAVLMNGIGEDIWGVSDAFRFAYKNLSGNGSIVARVNSLYASDPWAKAGVMIRQNASVSAANAMMAKSASDGNGASFQWRLTTAADSSNTSPTTAVAFPYWVKLERNGNSISAYISPDGAAWTQLGQTQTIAMTDPVLIGLAVCSHNSTVATYADFSDVATTGNVTGNWEIAEIGTAQVGGNSVERLYLTVKDSSKTATLLCPDALATGRFDWQQWLVPLSDLTAAGVKVTAIRSIAVGVGNPTSPAAGGTGTMYFDDLAFGKPVP
jgi:hypothetical protein